MGELRTGLRGTATWVGALRTGLRGALRLAWLVLVPGLAACNSAFPDTRASDAEPAAPWVPESDGPPPKPGMVWIPGGVLIAGTPLNNFPRVADEEMAGEQVVMRSYYIDIFPMPNEAGAIPTTNISQAEARSMCEEVGKRLCTELELERACKGPANSTYEYGNTYSAPVCGTGTSIPLVPNGLHTGCASPFGVHDLHGGVWSWTSSEWRRDPSKPGLVAVRGGNGASGELVGRCANGKGVLRDAHRDDVGVRCCAGDANTFEVVLSVTRGEPLRQRPSDGPMVNSLEALLPSNVRADMAAGQPASRKEAHDYKIDHLWTWHPLGNEELWIGGGCAGKRRREGVRGKPQATCGILIARKRLDEMVLLDWVPSEYWQPILREAESPRELFLHGGDDRGAFRRKLSYAWGRLVVEEKERKRKRLGQSEPTYWPP